MDKLFIKKVIPSKFCRSHKDRSRYNSQDPQDRAIQIQHDANATSEVSPGIRPSTPTGPQPASTSHSSSFLSLHFDDLIGNPDGQATNSGIIVTPPGAEERRRSLKSFIPSFGKDEGRLRSPNSAGKTAKNVLKGTLAALSSALEGVPLPAAKGIVDATRKLITVFEATKANTEMLDDLNTRCKHLLEVVINPLKAKDEDEISPEFGKIINRLEGRLLGLISEIDQPQPGITSRMVNNEDISLALKDINDKITQHINLFMLETHVLGLISQENLSNVVKKYALHQTIQNLPRANASYDSYLDTPQTRSVCFQTTRQQLLGEIIEWITSTDLTKPPIYILDGIAGIGKSTVAQTIASRCAQLGYLGASFFFSRAENDRKTARLFFSSLVFDLANYSPEFAQGIQTALEKTPSAPEKTLSQQLRYLLVDPLQGLSLKQPIVVVIDALDECENIQAAEIINLLVNNLQSLPGFRFFITTRPEPHINVVLKQYREHEHFYLHEIEASIVEADIRSYLKYELSPTRVQKALPGVEWNLNEDDVNSLVKHAGRLFIIASTVIRFVLDPKRYAPQFQMTKMLGALKNERSIDPTKVMDVMYLNILQSGILDGSDEDIVSLFQQVVGIIVVLENPLPLSVLAVFLGMGQSEVVAALSPIHSIIAPSSTDQAPQVYHKSFPDFITDLERCGDARLYISVEKHHAKAASYCFNILNAKLHQNMLKVEGLQRFKYNKDIDVNNLVDIHLGLELQYACTYWATHLSKAGKHNKGELIEMLKKFSFAHLMHWLETLSWLEQVDSAYYAILKAQEYVTDIEEEGLKSMLTDIGLCVTKYYRTFSRSAGHIYISVVPFLPQETEIYRAYAEKSSDSGKVVVLKGQEVKWNPLLAVLDEHSSRVTSIVFSTDGSRLASGSFDSTVILWDGLIGAPIAALDGHSGKVTAVVFSPDGTRLASGSHDHIVMLWNGLTGNFIAKLEGHSKVVTSVAFAPDGTRLASGSYDNTVRLWNGWTGAPIATLKGHSDMVGSVVFSPDGSRLASGSDDYTVMLWNGWTGIPFTTLEGHSDRITAVVFSPDGSRLASGSNDSTVKLWNGWTGAPIATLEGHAYNITSISFSPDGSRLASSSDDYTVILWNGLTGTPIATLNGHSKGVTSVVFSADGSRLASGSYDKNVMIWNGMTGAPIATLKGHSEEVTLVLFSPDGSRLASGSHDCTVMLWNGLTNVSIATLEGHSKEVRSVTFSPDGSKLASCSFNSMVVLWNGLTGVPMATLDRDYGCVTSIIFSPDGSRLAVLLGFTLVLWNVQTYTDIAELEGGSEAFISVVFSPDGTRLASGSYGNTVRLWNGWTGASIATLEGHSDTVGSVVFSPDGSRLASGSDDYTVMLWNGLTGASIATSGGHSDGVISVVFSPDGSRMASGSHDNTVRLWNGWTGALIAILEGHSSWVSSIMFSPDGFSLASRSDDYTAMLWNGFTGAFIALLKDSRQITPIVFSVHSFTSSPDTKPDLGQVQNSLDIQYNNISLQLTPSDLISENNDIIYNNIDIPIFCMPLHLPISTRLSIHGTHMACGCSNGKIIILDCSSSPFMLSAKSPFVSQDSE